jgi:LuxR family transcriptional regulator, maltose regulon positive regulatory protein
VTTWGSWGAVLMAGPVLETKLHVPRRRRGLVARPRLSERLSRGAESVLTLVSAPAGFGKTTLLAEWLAAAPSDGRSVAWLSLGQRDNDPELFWTYVVAALTTAAQGAGASALSVLQPPQPPSEAGLATLLNDLDAISNDVVLVLDDYHVIDARDVQDGMTFLLEHLPPQIHLVVGSRADPALPLARLRARGELAEIRAADLRFTPGEAAAYLNEAMGLALTTADVAALERRTEGWIAALQLAALSLQGREDTTAFIAGFAGDDRYIVDYLAEEVLQRQPEHVQHFLLQTSILDRLCGPLCDAVTGQDGGKAKLAGLERGNLFLVPLDDRRRWYRYHQLFADVLQAHLRDEQPEDVSDLHRRASAWYQQNGDPAAAIRHALAAGDFERAADLVELAIPAMRKSRQEAAVRGWLELLPDEVIRVRPVLSVGFAGTLLIRGELEGVEARLRDAERWLDGAAGIRQGSQAPSAEMVVVDDEEFRRLPAMIELYRAAQAVARGDVPGTVRHARQTLDLAPADDHLRRAGASGMLGLVFWSSGSSWTRARPWPPCSERSRNRGPRPAVLQDVDVSRAGVGEPEHPGRIILVLSGLQEQRIVAVTAETHVGEPWPAAVGRAHDERQKIERRAQAGLPVYPGGDPAYLRAERLEQQRECAVERVAEAAAVTVHDLVDQVAFVQRDRFGQVNAQVLERHGQLVRPVQRTQARRVTGSGRGDADAVQVGQHGCVIHRHPPDRR